MDSSRQALEVKLQVAPTIDLGLVTPASEEPAVTLSPRLRHCDAHATWSLARHAKMRRFGIQQIVTSTGADFFEEVPALRRPGAELAALSVADRRSRSGSA